MACGRINRISPDSPRQGRITILGFSVVTLMFLLMGAIFFPQFLRLRKGVNKVACYNMQKKLSDAIFTFGLEHTQNLGRSDGSIDQVPLLGGKFLFYKLECPESGRFLFDREKIVTCSLHPSRALETSHSDIIEIKKKREAEKSK